MENKRKCDVCGKKYVPDPRNIKRGWGLTCSKTCAAKKREKSRPTYDAETVAENNIRRDNWNKRYSDNDGYDPGDSEYWDSKDFSF